MQKNSKNIEFNQKVEKLKIFDYTIIKSKIPKFLYDDDLLRDDICKHFEKVKKSKSCVTAYETDGSAISTVVMQNKDLMLINLKNITPLINYISHIILIKFFQKNPQENLIIFNKMWMNMSFLNSSVNCHVHDQKHLNSGTAIFYFNVPKNGSELIILEKNIGNNSVAQHHKKISHYIKVMTGDLVIHSSEVPHATSKNMCNEPRICLVFDFVLKENSKKTLKTIIYR